MIHLPLLRIILPSNVILVYRIIIPLIMFDIFENEYDIGPQSLFEFDEEG